LSRGLSGGLGGGPESRDGLKEGAPVVHEAISLAEIV
jgi:hypothetical protein